MNKDEEIVEIDLMRIVKQLLSHILIIILTTVLGGALAIAGTKLLITPLYQSGIKLYVNNSSFSVGSASFSISNAELSAAQNLVDTYIVILKTRTVINEVVKKADVDYTYEEMVEKISAAPINSTEVFEVVINDPDPYLAEKLANTVATVLPEKVSKIVDGSSMRIVDYAVVPSEKSSPSLKKNGLIGALLGFLTACGIITLMTVFDNVIRCEEDVMSNYNLPLLAAVPDIDKAGKASRSKSYYKSQYESAGEVKE